MRAVLGARKWLWLALLGALFGGGWLWWWTASGADLDSMERLVRRRFPSVRQISTAEFADWMRSSQRAPLILDVRTPEEYAVSHLPGARRIDPDARGAQLDLGIPKDAPIVTYCSVGYRSSAFAQKLQQAGYANVQNLEGSIFKWANEDRPLVTEGSRPAAVVHPYSNYWGRLVKPERRAPLPVK